MQYLSEDTRASLENDRKSILTFRQHQYPHLDNTSIETSTNALCGSIISCSFIEGVLLQTKTCLRKERGETAKGDPISLAKKINNNFNKFRAYYTLDKTDPTFKSKLGLHKKAMFKKIKENGFRCEQPGCVFSTVIVPASTYDRIFDFDH